MGLLFSFIKPILQGEKMERILDPKARDFDREFSDRLYYEKKTSTLEIVEEKIREAKIKRRETLDKWAEEVVEVIKILTPEETQELLDKWAEEIREEQDA